MHLTTKRSIYTLNQFFSPKVELNNKVGARNFPTGARIRCSGY